jgi:Ca2+-binding RTX toxin-like protein
MLARLTALVAAVLVLPASAGAATVSIHLDATFSKFGTSQINGSVLEVMAAPGEVNQVAVALDGATVVLTDTGTPPIAGDGCATADAAHVRCTAPGPLPALIVDADLGDGDDAIDTTGLPPETTKLMGSLGPGADRALLGGRDNQVAGGDGDDVLIGGPHRDFLGGDAGRDELRGGAGDDSLDGGVDADPDVLDGGDGFDTVNIPPLAPAGPMREADLAAGRIGGVDQLIAIEQLWGGTNRDDVLRGGPGDDEIDGQGSAHGDRLEGRAGDDHLFTRGPGHDVALGGPGNDVLQMAAGTTADGGPGDDTIGRNPWVPAGRARVTARCGAGHDVLGDFAIAVPRDCEALDRAGLARIGRPRVTGGSLRVTLTRTGVACALRLRVVDARDRPLSAWRRVALVAGRRVAPTLRLRRAPSAHATLGLALRPADCRTGETRARVGTVRFAR